MNKKGAALALVLIIGVVLASSGALMFTMANSSISSADTGIKSREAHANAKSGYDFIRAFEPTAYGIVGSEMWVEYSEKMENRDYYPDYYPNPGYSTLITQYLGYMDEEGNFVLKDKDGVDPISKNTPAFKNARIQIEIKLTRTHRFDETNSDTKAGTFSYEAKLEGWSKGRSDEVSGFTDILEKGIELHYNPPVVEGEKEYGGVYINPLEIPGTNLEVDYIFNETFKPGLLGKWAAKGDTFYYNDKYYIAASGRFVYSINSLDQLLVPPVWDLTGWNGSGKTSMNNHLAQHNSGFPAPLKKYAVVKYNNNYYVYLDPIGSPKAPGVFQLLVDAWIDL